MRYAALTKSLVPLQGTSCDSAFVHILVGTDKFSLQGVAMDW